MNFRPLSAVLFRELYSGIFSGFLIPVRVKFIEMQYLSLWIALFQTGFFMLEWFSQESENSYKWPPTLCPSQGKSEQQVRKKL